MRYFLLLLLILISVVASASIEISPNTVFQINNANISFSTTQGFDSLGMGSNYLKINGSTLTLTPSYQTTININQYNTIIDVYNLSILGNSSLTGTQTAHARTTYDFYINGTKVTSLKSNPNSILGFTFDLNNNTQIYLWQLGEDLGDRTNLNDACDSASSNWGAIMMIFGVLLIVASVAPLMTSIGNLSGNLSEGKFTGLGVSVTVISSLIIGIIILFVGVFMYAGIISGFC